MSRYSGRMHVALLLGSKADTEYAQKIADFLKDFDVPSEIIVASAHKVPEKVVTEIEKLNARKDPTVVIAVVGMSNGLGGVLAGSCVHPIISCPPYKDLNEYMVDIHSNLRMPSDVPVMTVLNYKNAALCALRILGESDAKLKGALLKRIEKIKAEY